MQSESFGMPGVCAKSSKNRILMFAMNKEALILGIVGICIKGAVERVTRDCTPRISTRAFMRTEWLVMMLSADAWRGITNGSALGRLKTMQSGTSGKSVVDCAAALTVRFPHVASNVNGV